MPPSGAGARRRDWRRSAKRPSRWPKPGRPPIQRPAQRLRRLGRLQRNPGLHRAPAPSPRRSIARLMPRSGLLKRPRNAAVPVPRPLNASRLPERPPSAVRLRPQNAAAMRLNASAAERNGPPHRRGRHRCRRARRCHRPLSLRARPVGARGAGPISRALRRAPAPARGCRPPRGHARALCRSASRWPPAGEGHARSSPSRWARNSATGHRCRP